MSELDRSHPGEAYWVAYLLATRSSKRQGEESLDETTDRIALRVHFLHSIVTTGKPPQSDQR